MILPAEIRRRFGDVGTYMVDGHMVSALQLSRRTMNFGQHWRTCGLETVSYSVVLPKPYLVDWLRRMLPEYVEDAVKFPDPNSELESALRTRDWPDLEVILENARLAELVLSSFASELLVEWFGDGEPVKQPGFVMNTVDSVGFSGESPRIAGTARRAGISVKYQDA